MFSFPFSRGGKFLVSCVASLAALLLSTPAWLFAQAPQTAASVSGQGQRVILPHTANRLPPKAKDEGLVRSDLPLRNLILLLRPSQKQQTALRHFLDTQQDSNSPHYHQWLTPAQFRQRFGLSNAKIHTVEGWLEQNGFKVSKVSSSGRWIEISGTANQVESAFHAKIHRILVHGESHILNTQNLAVPRNLAPMIGGIVSLNDFFKHPQITTVGTVRRKLNQPWKLVQPQTTNGNGGQFISPADLRAIYNLNPLYQNHIDGKGESIAIAGRTDIFLSDIQAYREAFNLPVLYPNVIVNGVDPGLTSDVIEASLDIELAGAVAPETAIDYVESASTNTTDGIDLSAAYAVDHDLAPVLSVSYAGCEAQLGPTENAFWNSLWEQAAAEGISVVVAAGDTGAAECDDGDYNQPASQGLAVNGLASTPYDTAAGGTEFNEGSNMSTYWNSTNGTDLQTAIGYIPEEVWNESCDPTVSGSQCPNGVYSLDAGGGGVSSIYSKPSWQTGTGVPADGMRDLPDVSLASAAYHDGYLICQEGSCLFSGGNGSPTTLDQASVVGGTSAAAPAFAGMMALIDQKMGARQGLANYFLYKIAAGENLANCNSSTLTDPTTPSTCSLYDITTGNNSIPGQTGYQAATGYDLASGLGSVNAANLANAWATVKFASSTTTLSVGTTTAAHGQQVQISGAVTGSGQSYPTGTVTFLSDKYGPVGSATLDSTGHYSTTISNLPGGQYNLTASYSGDAAYGGSQSSPVAMNITPESSQITVGAYNYINGPPEPLTSAPYGDYVYFIATVTGASGQGSATGSVSFYDNGTLLGTSTISGKGSAVLISAGAVLIFVGPTPICLGVGQHTITATYSGDNSFSASKTPQALAFTVTKGNSATPHFTQITMTLNSTQELVIPVYIGGAGTIPATGTVQFLDNGSPLNSPVKIVQQNSLTTPMAWLEANLAAGSHTITATYSGDSNYLAEPSDDQLALQVNTASGVPVKITLTPSGTTSTVGDYTTFTAKVTSTQTSPTITGTMQLYDAYGIAAGLPVQVSNGAATLPMQWGFAGDQVETVRYSGDSTYAAGGATSASVSVARANPGIQLAVVPPNALGQVSMTATISDPATPGTAQGFAGATGKVQFYDSLNGGAAQPLGLPVETLQPIPLSNGLKDYAATQVSVLPRGLHTITATFLGSPEYNSVTSPSENVQVGTPGFQLSDTPTGLSIPSGQSGTVTLTLTSQNGFSGTTSLSCSSGVPAGAKCSFSPASVVLNASTGTATLTLSTTAPSTQSSAALSPGWLFPAGSSLALAIFLFPVARRKNRRLLSMLCAVCILVALQACGSGGGTSSGPTTPPPPQTSSTTISTSSTKVASGTDLTLKAKVTATSTPTGTVTFFDGSTSLGKANLDATGNATLTINTLSIGTHKLSAKYAGDTNTQASNSGVLDEAITGTVQLKVTATSGSLQQTVTVPVDVQ